MCQACDGLGVRHDFDPDLLVPDPSLSVWKGAIEPLGEVVGIGKWRKHIFEGVAANLESDTDGPKKGTMLKGPWRDLPQNATATPGSTARATALIVHRWRQRGRSTRTPRSGTASPTTCWSRTRSRPAGRCTPTSKST